MTFPRMKPARISEPPADPVFAIPRIPNTFAYTADQLKSLLMRAAKDDALREIDDLVARYGDAREPRHYTTADALSALERIRELTEAGQFAFAISEIDAMAFVRRDRDVAAAYAAAMGRDQ